ncbi:MAG TPA: hypothetical protein EYO84_12520, partial [Planctomycetes bacterium]|nr:hypothetical protein [Planctomycetota bacterium]
MSPSGVPARNRLLKLQRRLAEEARREIERSIDDPSGSLQRWRDTYEQATMGKLEPISIEEIA